MVNILVPTDFSDLSKVALDFAVKVANKLDGTVTLLHVVTLIQPTRASMRLRLEMVEEEIISCAKEDMRTLVAEVSGKLTTTHPIQWSVVQGSSFDSTVKKEAKRLRSGLIVMGTRGANGLKRVVLGSNTVSVLESSHIPVLVVPELAEFGSFSDLVFATDLRHLEDELQLMLPYIRIFDSNISIFHVVPGQDGVKEAIGQIEKAIAGMDYKKFSIHVEVAKDIDEAMEVYLKQNRCDLLTTFTREHSFYERLFDRSLTRKLAFHSKTPLLAFRQFQ